MTSSSPAGVKRQATPDSKVMQMADGLKLSTEPDGFGFFYGWAQRDGERVRVDVLPPDHLWRGDIKLEGQMPDPKAWVLYLNGEEFARVERREDLPVVLVLRAPTRPPGPARCRRRDCGPLTAHQKRLKPGVTARPARVL